LKKNETSAAGIEQIHALCEQHLDVAWLWPRVPQGEDLMRQCFERVIEMIEKYPAQAFVFTRSTAWSFYIVEQRHPALFARIKDYVARGKIALGGGQWVEPDHAIPGGEAMVRQSALGQWYFQKTFGIIAKVCWAPDTFAHAGTLPQILRKSGLEGYRLSRCLPRDPSGKPFRQFIWRGIDGSELLAFYPWLIRNGFNAETVRQALPKLAGAGLPCAIIKPDDSYSDRRITLEPDWVTAPEAVNAEPGLPTCRWSSADDIVKDMQRYRNQLPAVEGELGFECTGTYTTDGRYKRKNRMLETLLPNAEKAACWAALHGCPYPGDQLRQAWMDLCLNQFHDLSCGSSFGEVLDEADRLNTEIESRARWALEQSLSFLCDRLHAARKAQGHTEEEVALFSFLSSPRTSPALIPAAPQAPAGYLDESGRAVASQRVICRDGSQADLVLHSSDGMHIGIYRRTRATGPASSPPIASGNCLENEYVRVEIDPHSGDITRLRDKLQNMEYLPPAGRGNRLEFLEEANLVPHPPWCTMEPWHISYTGKRFEPEARIEINLREKGPLRGCIRVSRRMQLHADMPETVIVQDIMLYRHSPVLHFETRGQWHAERLMLKACFDLPFTAARVDADVAYGVAERRLPQHLDNNASQATGIGEEWKSAKDAPPEPDRFMQMWLDLSDGAHGLLILNNGKYGYDAEEKQVGLSLMRAPNMRPWKGDILGLGPFEFSYAVMPHAGDWRAVDAPRLGYEFNNEPVVWPIRPGFNDFAGSGWWKIANQPPEAISPQFLAIRGAGAQVTAVKQAEDCEGLIVRVVECLGAAKTCTLACCRPVQSVMDCDLLERPLASPKARILPKGGEFQIPLSAFEIKTLRIRLA